MNRCRKTTKAFGSPVLIMCAVFFALLSAPAGAGWQRVSADGRRAISPELAVGPDGAINVIWLDKGLTADRPPPKPRKPGEHSHRSSTDLYFSRSEDRGRTWSAPARVNPADGDVWGFAVSKPRINVGPTGTIHVFYPANDKSPKTGLDVVSARYTRSIDNGKSFSTPIVLNRPAEIDRSDMLGEGLAMTHSFGTMGVGPDGTVITAWQEVAHMADATEGANGAVAISRDDGKTFEAEHIVLPNKDVCPCCQLTIAFGDDTTYIGYRKIYADGRDSAVARSTDGGRSFDAVTRLDLARWDIDGCPLKTTELAIDGDNVYVATYTGGEEPAALYFSRSTDGGRVFSGSRQVHAEAAYSDAPELTVDGAGAVRIVWHAKVGGPRRLFTSVSLDGGATLSSPTEIETPAGTSAYPATDIAADGTVFVAWQQENEEVFVTSLPAAAERVTLMDATELAAELEARRGRVVLVNFWATWCRPCLDEIPDLMALETELGARGFDVLPVSLDDPAELEATIKPFLHKWFPTFTSYLSVERDRDRMVSVIDPAWNEVLPTSYVLARNGTVAARMQGGSSAEEFAAAIRPIL